MRKLLYVLALTLVPSVAFAGPNPPWAYPVGPAAPQRDASKIITVPGSDKKYNEVEVNNPFGPPDWFPNEHPAMPKVVAQGNRPEPRYLAGAHARNPKPGFSHSAPPGSIKKGEELATTGGGGKTVACAVCHGPGLRGLGPVPPIANRDPLYVVRQLNDMQNSARTGNSMALMKQVVAKLTLDDMIALAAYVGSLEP